MVSEGGFAETTTLTKLLTSIKNIVICCCCSTMNYSEIKTQLKSVGRTGADLGRALELNYETLNRYLNGRAKTPSAVERKIKEKINEWRL